MKTKRDEWLATFEQDREQWLSDHAGWLDGFRKMKRCEQRVMGLMFELESALPNHQGRVNKLQEIVLEHEQYLVAHAGSQPRIRDGFIDDQCPVELAAFKKMGMSRCQSCEPKCLDCLQEEHHKAGKRHASVARKYHQLCKEFETALEEMNKLANDLERCLKPHKS